MENNKIGDNVIDEGKEVVKKLNIFTVFQVAWLIEIYYLGLNSILNSQIVENIYPGINLPALAKQYNDMILVYCKDWNNFIMLLASGMFICGVAFSPIKDISRISDYNIIYRYCEHGKYISKWLFLIYFSYLAYLKLEILFLFLPLTISMVDGLIKNFKKE